MIHGRVYLLAKCVKSLMCFFNKNAVANVIFWSKAIRAVLQSEYFEEHPVDFYRWSLGRVSVLPSYFRHGRDVLARFEVAQI